MSSDIKIENTSWPMLWHFSKCNQSTIENLKSENTELSKKVQSLENCAVKLQTLEAQCQLESKKLRDQEIEQLKNKNKLLQESNKKLLESVEEFEKSTKDLKSENIEKARRNSTLGKKLVKKNQSINSGKELEIQQKKSEIGFKG